MSPCTLRCPLARYAACALRCHPARSRRVQSPHGSITLHGFCDFAQNDTVEGRSVCHPARYAVPLHATPPARYAACALRCHPARSRRVQSPHGSITLHGFCDFAQNDTVEGRSVCHPARYAVTPRATLSPRALRCHPARYAVTLRAVAGSSPRMDR